MTRTTATALLVLTAVALVAPTTPAVADSAPLWVAISDGATREPSSDYASAIAVSPRTGNVVVTGSSAFDSTDIDYSTVAYDDTGIPVAAAAYDSAADLDPDYDSALALAVNPFTGASYVTGASDTADANRDVVTVAYDPSGRQQWVARYSSAGEDEGIAIAVDTATGNVYVGANTDGNLVDYLTIAYSPDGEQLWAATYDGPVGRQERASDLVVDPETGVVYVSGDSQGQGSALDFATVAYSPTGQQLWVARYDDGNELAPRLGFATGQLIVSGQSQGATADFDFATVAYSRRGDELWAARFASPGATPDIAIDVAVDKLSGGVYVIGNTYRADGPGDIVTVAYTADGMQRWVRVNPNDGDDNAVDVAVDARRGTVYVVGTSKLRVGEPPNQLTTLAYDRDGILLRTDHYSRPDGIGQDRADGVAVDPRTGRVYVTGTTRRQGGAADFTTIAYPPAVP